MTDTGQIPGEGLPENAGMVEQPGVPAPGAFTYLSESTAEDEDLLLLPGAQSAWGNEVAPPAPEPVVETVHQPGPHEMSGRDTGSVDLGAVRLPDPAPAPVAAPVPPRRPLHLGPPIPDTSASPVRSLADRGPAGAPVRHAGPPTVGPEYLDVPQAAAMSPQGAAPWGAQMAPQTVEAPAAQVSAGATHAETVVPVPDQVPEPVGAAQALVARVETEAVAATGGATEETGGLDEPGEAVVAGVAESPAADAPAGTETGTGTEDAPGNEVAYGPETPVEGDAARGEEPGDVTEAAVAGEASAPQAVPGPEADLTPAVTVVPAASERESGAEFEVAPEVGPEVGGAAGPDPASGAVPVPVPDSVPVPVAEAVPAPVAEPPAEPEPVEPAQSVQSAPNQSVQSVQSVQGVSEQPVPAEPRMAEAAEAPEPVQAVEPPEAPEPQAVPLPEAPAPLDAQPPDVPAAAQAPVAIAPEAVGPEPSPETESPAAPEQPAPVQEEAVPPQPAARPVPQPVPQSVPQNTVHPHSQAQPDAQSAPQGAVPQPDVQPAAPQAAVLRPDALPVPDGTQPAQGPQSVVTADVPREAGVPQESAVAPGTPAAPEPRPDRSAGGFVPVDGGQVPVAPHLAPTPPEAVVLPLEAPRAPAPDPAAAVPAPREAGPEVVQDADDLDTRAADQTDQEDPHDVSTAAVEETEAAAEVRQPTGPAAPAYDDAEREAVLKVMRERRDIRNGFRNDPIPHEVLLRVLEAAHTAPSVGHSQPWDFVVIRSADTRRAMHELATRQRDAYAKSLPKGRAKQFKELKIEAILDTPVNIVVTADPTRGGRHTLGRHTQPQMAPYSSALAVENLWLAARAEGLGVGWVSFFDEREMVRALGLPEHLDVVAYLCVGYVDEFPDEPELMQAGWSKRRPLSWVVHEETYGRRALPGEAPHDLLAETVAQIRPLDAKALGEAWERQKRMTKPAGALGMLEIISAQLSGLSRQCPPPIPEPAAVAVFAGDHGVHAQGVTPWPQEVTAQMVANFLGGGAVCNAFATQVGAEVCVVDVGVATDLPATPGLLPRKVRAGTSDMTAGPAMTREEAKQAIEVGIETARDLVAAGNKGLLTGEMGIANTTASAALISVFTGADPAEVTGRGTGINDETLVRKTEVVRRALELHRPDPADPVGVLAAVGGFEHAAMVGLLLGGASLRTPVILDGVSAGAAALVARAIAPEVLAACIAGHRSAEPGHVAALNTLGLRPLVDLDLRLGEGTGALLALPMVQSTARAMHEVATFDSAGVTEK